MSSRKKEEVPSTVEHTSHRSAPRAIGEIMADSDFLAQILSEPGSSKDATSQELSFSSADFHFTVTNNIESIFSGTQPDIASGTHANSQASSDPNSAPTRAPKTDTQNKQGVRAVPKSRQIIQNKKAAKPESPLVYLGEFAQIRTQQQERLLKVFQTAPHCRTTLGSLSRKLQIPYGSVRRILARLKELELIHYEHIREKKFQGLEIWYLVNASAPAVIPLDAATKFSAKGSAQVSSQTGHPHHIEERKKEETLSIWNITLEDLAMLWPKVQQAGFFPHHIHQARKAFEQQGWNTEGRA